MFAKRFVVIICLIVGLAFADNTRLVQNRPVDIIDAKTVIPQLQVDMRYFGSHNFIGRRITGYNAPKCLLSTKALTALKTVENNLLPMGLTLKVYDCYRPQMAVDDFVAWANDVNNTKMKPEFYPTVDKHNLFKDGYIASKSGHSRGSTLDLTIVPLNSKIPSYDRKQTLVSCSLPADKRFPDNSLDFGSGFDCFGIVAHPDYANLDPQIKANRLLLKSLMEDAGFIGLKEEWWHFTLKNEPYPTSYFNFPIR